METVSSIARLKRRCRDLRVTHDQIAAAAAITRPAVVNILAGRRTSRRVVEIARELVKQAERKRKPRAKNAAAA